MSSTFKDKDDYLRSFPRLGIAFDLDLGNLALAT